MFIQLGDEGIDFRVSIDEEPCWFRWDDVDEIRTFKLDLLAFDDVRLAFHVANTWYEFSEEDHGFAELAAILRHRFQSIPENWLAEVTHPPFATNERTLWKRD